MFENVRRISKHACLPPVGEIAELLRRLQRLPFGYREWMMELGEGALCGELSLFSPQRLVAETAEKESLLRSLCDVLASVHRRPQRGYLLGMDANGANLVFDEGSGQLHAVHLRDREVHEMRLSKPHDWIPVACAEPDPWPSDTWFTAAVPRATKEFAAAEGTDFASTVELLRSTLRDAVELDYGPFCVGMTTAVAAFHWPAAGAEVRIDADGRSGPKVSLDFDEDSSELVEAFAQRMLGG